MKSIIYGMLVVALPFGMWLSVKILVELQTTNELLLELLKWGIPLK